MNLFVRLLVVLLGYRTRSACDVFGPCVTPFRVLPTDLDVLGHVNNGVYLSILDAARTDLILRSGLFPKLRKAGFYPVVAAETIRFKRSLKLFERFVVVTRVIGWDEKAFIIEHRFMVGETLAAEAVIRSRFLRRSGGGVDPSEILGLVGRSADNPPELPSWIAAWNDAQVGQARNRTSAFDSL